MKNTKKIQKKLIQRFIGLLIVFTPLFILTQPSSAYLALNETAELLKEDHYRFGVAPQLLLTNGSGINVGAFFDLPIENDINSRLMIGGGSTDFWTSASVKWVPYPDFRKQPAIGIRGSLIYARDAALDFYNLQATPIISKIIDTQWGKMNPYVGLPITLIYNRTTSSTAMQFVIGNEWLNRSRFQIGAELNLNLSNTSTAIAFHINFPFDKKIGFRQ